MKPTAVTVITVKDFSVSRSQIGQRFRDVLVEVM